MLKSRKIASLAAIACGALVACGGAAPAPLSPAAGAASPSVEAAAPASAATSQATEGKSTMSDPPAAVSPANAKAPAPAAKATSGSIVGQVDVTPARLGKNVVVYLENAPATAAKPVVTTIDQRRMAFSPFVTVLPVGGKVIFRNDDPFPHNIFSPDHEHFDLGTMPHGGARAHVFKTPGAYSLLCNIHPGMLAYIYVVPTTYYALADQDGKYKIDNVPPGTWKIAAWGPKLAVASQSVTMSGGSVTANLSLHRER